MKSTALSKWIGDTLTINIVADICIECLVKLGSGVISSGSSVINTNSRWGEVSCKVNRNVSRTFAALVKVAGSYTEGYGSCCIACGSVMS